MHRELRVWVFCMADVLKNLVNKGFMLKIRKCMICKLYGHHSMCCCVPLGSRCTNFNVNNRVLFCLRFVRKLFLSSGRTPNSNAPSIYDMSWRMRVQYIVFHCVCKLKLSCKKVHHLASMLFVFWVCVFVGLPKRGALLYKHISHHPEWHVGSAKDCRRLPYPTQNPKPNTQIWNGKFKIHNIIPNIYIVWKMTKPETPNFVKKD